MSALTDNGVIGKGTQIEGRNFGIEVSGYRVVTIENNHIANGTEYGIALRAFVNSRVLHDFDWHTYRIKNNVIDNFSQAIFVMNAEKENGFYPSANKIEVTDNTVLSSWNADNKAHIHFIGSQFSNSVVTGNQLYGGSFGIWPEPDVAEENGVLIFDNNHYN